MVCILSMKEWGKECAVNKPSGTGDGDENKIMGGKPQEQHIIPRDFLAGKRDGALRENGAAKPCFVCFDGNLETDGTQALQYRLKKYAKKGGIEEIHFHAFSYFFIEYITLRKKVLNH